jgi:hypothetical protein
MPNDQLLLIVFLPEHGDIRLNEREQACHNRRYAVEMARPRRAAEIPGQPGNGHYSGFVDAEGIHGIDVRRKENIRVEILQPLSIALQCAWIICKVLAFAELRWIDEYCYDDAFRMLAGEFDEAQVTFVKVAHCRHKGDVIPMVAPALVQLAQFVPRADYLHRRRLAIRKNSAREPGSCGP